MPVEILHFYFLYIKGFRHIYILTILYSKDIQNNSKWCRYANAHTNIHSMSFVTGQFWFLKRRIAFRCLTVAKDIPLWNDLDERSLFLLYFLFHLRLTSNCNSCYKSVERKIEFFISTRFCLLLVSWNSSIAIDSIAYFNDDIRWKNGGFINR